ncbi:zinc finger domain-containing protein [Streptomyces sp. NPDC005166]
MAVAQEASPSDADDVERQLCPRCRAEPGSPCRSRSGAVAGTYSESVPPRLRIADLRDVLGQASEGDL